MTNLAMGGNALIASPEIVLDIHLPGGTPIDVCALQLYSGGKVRGDSDMCFFNQPSISNGAVVLKQSDNIHSLSLNLAGVGSEVEKLVVNATMDHGQFSAVSDLKISTSCGISILVDTSNRSEAALILCEIYRRNSQWKIRNVSQGFNGGLQALAEHFGMEIEPSPSAKPVPENVPEPSPEQQQPVITTTSTPTPTPNPEPTSFPSSDVTSAASTSSSASTLFTRLKQSAITAGTKLSTEASRFKNRTFMEAVVNGCVLVAAADGNIDASEKQKMAGFIERSDELKHFDLREVIDVFQNAAAMYESDSAIGKACALENIRKIKGNQEQARLLVRVVAAIGAADGDFDEQEKQMVSAIANELDIDPADL